MAGLSERGQMLLLGAIILAVLFISLSLVLNGSIHTTTMAGEASADVSASETIALQNAMQRDVETLMAAAIRANPDDFNQQENYVDATLPDVGDSYSEYYARQDRIVDVESYHVEEGAKIEHTGGRFSDLMISSNTELRHFDIEVAGPGDNSGAFAIVIDGSWVIDIDITGTGYDIDVSGPGTTAPPCSGSGMPRIEVTNATVDGNPCPALEFFEDIDFGYSVEFQNGDEIEGEYEFIASDENAAGPSDEEIIYEVVVDLEERSPRISYASDVTVAPGEPT